MMILVLAACVRGADEPLAPSLDVAAIASKIPHHVKDREGWARDVHAAITAIELEPTAANVCAVLAIVEQESGYQADPTVKNLPEIVRDGLESKLSVLGPLAGPAVSALLAGKAPGSKQSFKERIATLRTERDLDRLFRDVADAYKGKLPAPFSLASGVLDDYNPVTTAGSMQAKVSFARTLDEFKNLSDAEARELLYTRAGGIRAGTARLLGYQAQYTDLIYRFADYNSGPYSSRNAAFQEQLASLLGRPLALDGDLLAYDDDGDAKDIETKSLAALKVFGKARDHWDWTIERAASQEKSQDFEDTDLWEEVRAAYKNKTGREAPYARMPEVEIRSPKLKGARSTRWFAENVQRRHKACLARS